MPNDAHLLRFLRARDFNLDKVSRCVIVVHVNITGTDIKVEKIKICKNHINTVEGEQSVKDYHLNNT